MTNGPTEVVQAYHRAFGEAPTLVLRSAGRINLIGEHTDYNDGWVLPGSIDRYIYFALGKNDQNNCHALALDLAEKGQFSVAVTQKSDQQWLNYLQGIFRQFQQDGHELTGVNVALGGNLPVGAGVSASAALECGFALGLQGLFGTAYTRPELALLAQRSCNEFIGVPVGVMDQYASLMGGENELLVLDCRKLLHQAISAEFADYQLVLFNTMVAHDLADGAYAERVAACQAGVAAIQKDHPEVTHLRDVNLKTLLSYEAVLDPLVFRRCMYVIRENNRVHAAIQRLHEGDLASLGRLLYMSHDGLKNDYGVSCPELDFLVDWTRDKAAILGARMMGGGFGGCTINLIQQSAIPALLPQVSADYEAYFGRSGEALVVSLAGKSEEIHV